MAALCIALIVTAYNCSLTHVAVVEEYPSPSTRPSRLTLLAQSELLALEMRTIWPQVRLLSFI